MEGWKLTVYFTDMLIKIFHALIFVMRFGFIVFKKLFFWVTM